MRIFHGVDLVDVSKFRAVFSRHPSFALDLFTEDERSYCESRRDPCIHFAERFAAKEAALKALGIGITAGIDQALRDVEVSRSNSGKPALRLHGWVGKTSKRMRVCQAAVSIAHSAQYAVATVILLSQGE